MTLPPESKEMIVPIPDDFMKFLSTPELPAFLIWMDGVILTEFNAGTDVTKEWNEWKQKHIKII